MTSAMEDRMKDLSSFIIGAAAGALLTYYLDAQSGGRRRALVRDKLIGAGHDACSFAEAKGKRAADRIKGVLATGHLDGHSRRPPGSDAQLHDRIRARLGRVISHPRALHVEVSDGCVTLSGDLLSKELDPLLSQVQGMAGVRMVENQLIVHDRAEGIPQLQGRQQPPGSEAGGEPDVSWRH
jgi:hypothetical protein